MEADNDLAGTPVSCISLTPPTPPDIVLDLPHAVIAADDLVEPDREDLRADVELVAEPAACEPPDVLEDIFAQLDAAEDAAVAPPRRGRRLRAYEVLSRDRPNRPEEDDLDMQPEWMDEPGELVPLPPRLAIHDAPADAALVPVRDAPGVQDEAADILPVIYGGYAFANELPRTVHEQVVHLSEHPAAMDSAMYTFLQEKIRSGTVKSLNLEAELSHLDPRTCRKAKHRWAAMFVMWLICTRTMMESLLVSDSVRNHVVDYFEWQRYDETPLPVRVQEQFENLVTPSADVALELAVVGIQGMGQQLAVKSNSGAKKSYRRSKCSAWSFKPLLACSLSSLTIQAHCSP